MSISSCKQLTVYVEVVRIKRVSLLVSGMRLTSRLKRIVSELILNCNLKAVMLVGANISHIGRICQRGMGVPILGIIEVSIKQAKKSQSDLSSVTLNRWIGLCQGERITR